MTHLKPSKIRCYLLSLLATALLSMAAVPAVAADIGAGGTLHYVYISTINERYTPRSIAIWNSADGGYRCYKVGSDYGGRELKTKFIVYNGKFFAVHLHMTDNCSNAYKSGYPTPVRDANKYWYVTF